MCGYMLNNSSINRNIKSIILSTTTYSFLPTTTKNPPPSSSAASSSFCNCSAKKFTHYQTDFPQRGDIFLRHPPAVIWGKSFNNWQIVFLSIIILLQCCTSEYYVAKNSLWFFSLFVFLFDILLYLLNFFFWEGFT